jgi:peptidoglycan/xylan/chitin deacetylase (PgdA/CDA1 family)
MEVTGAEDVREIPRADGLYLTVPSSLPTSSGLDAGTRIELRPDPALALRMQGQRVYWSDWALNPVTAEEAAGADVAVATIRTAEGGRVSWFGMRTGQAATAQDSVRLERLLLNGIGWAAGVPSAGPATWPGAARAAVMFVLDVEGHEPSVQARDAAAVFEAERLPVTFFVVTGLVEDDVELASALVRAGEVGTQTIDHVAVTGLTRQEQAIRLRRSRDHLADWSGREPQGLHPPEDSYDALTLDAWRRAGGSYLLASNQARSASPEIHATDAGPVVVLPRLLKDDYAVVVRDVTLRSQRLADAFLAGTAKMRAIGGLAVVAGHTQIIVTGPRLDAFRQVAESVRTQGGWWMAEGQEIADWWLARSQVVLTWESPTAPRESLDGMLPVDLSDLVVTSGSETTLSNLWIDIVVPALPEGAIPLVNGVFVDHTSESWGVRVSIGDLAPGVAVRVSFALPVTHEGS